MVLAPFINPILTALRWLAITAFPFMASAFVVGFLVKVGVAITSWAVILLTAETLRDIAVEQMANIGAGEVGVSVLGLLGLFGVFEGLSLIVSTMLAKATWLAIRPSLTWLTTPS